MSNKMATRDAYGKALVEFAEQYDLYVFDADLAAATKTGTLKDAYPERFFDCGIAWCGNWFWRGNCTCYP